MKYIINYRKVTILVLNLLLSIFISNCSPIPSMVPSITPSGSENILPATTSELPIFNPTDLAPIITSTATQIIIPLVERRCMQSAEEPLPALEGRLVLAGYRLEGFSSWTDGQSYLYDLQDSSSTLLGTTRYETVSPNGDLLAYYEKSSDLVVVSGKEGSRILELSADNASLFPAYWIDNQRLVLNKLLNHSFRSDFASLLIINPFTNEKEEWLPEFYQQDHGSYYDWKVTSNLIFNPSFNRLIYPVLANNQFDLVLLDLNADREIARIYEGAFRGNTPQWSPNSHYFITSGLIRGRSQNDFINVNDKLPYVGGSDLVLVGLDGQIRRLTYFTVTNHVSESNFVWSPDGRKIAFLQWDILHSYEPNLMVVDIETGIVSDYCKLAKPPLDANNLAVSIADPVWSPDGRYLVFTEIIDDYQYVAKLLELESGKAWEIAKDVSAMGWMRTP